MLYLGRNVGCFPHLEAHMVCIFLEGVNTIIPGRKIPFKPYIHTDLHILLLFVGRQANSRQIAYSVIHDDFSDTFTAFALLSSVFIVSLPNQHFPLSHLITCVLIFPSL